MGEGEGNCFSGEWGIHRILDLFFEEGGWILGLKFGGRLDECD